MALNLKNPEVDSLAVEVAALAKESKTEAVRRALLERKNRLIESSAAQTRSQRGASILRDFRASLPPEHLGRGLSRAEEDEILGFGPEGY
ncbi:MAG: type II toxin-antitoxin system VapB family antitoxin [Acidobacteria bacterium]|nr:type II toxin-antitoxin system VapB family antitoxin [Acidobacteriota bacterium]